MTRQAGLKMISSFLVSSLIGIACLPALAATDGREGPSATDYGSFGQSMNLAEHGLTVGGYASLQYQDLRNKQAHLSLSHLSMFVWWESESRLKFFSEIDAQGLLSSVSRNVEDERHYLSVERLYFDYAFNDTLTLRAGKYLTPIGRWNQGHADPLVWTTSRPLITRDLFPTNATGVMATGNLRVLAQQVEYTVFASTGNELRPDPDQDPFNSAYGARLNLPVNDNVQLGLSYASFDQRAMRDERKTLYGADFTWSSPHIVLSGEAIYRKSDAGGMRDAKGGFLQSVIPLQERLWAVARVEAMRDPESPDLHKQMVLGVNYRNGPATLLKLEFMHGFGGDQMAPAGLLSSVSVLF